jgi:hypothetical protein
MNPGDARLLQEVVIEARRRNVHSSVRWSSFYRAWIWMHPDAAGELGCYASAKTLAKLREIVTGRRAE